MCCVLCEFWVWLLPVTYIFTTLWLWVYITGAFLPYAIFAFINTPVSIWKYKYILNQGWLVVMLTFSGQHVNHCRPKQLSTCWLECQQSVNLLLPKIVNMRTFLINMLTFNWSCRPKWSICWPWKELFWFITAPSEVIKYRHVDKIGRYIDLLGRHIDKCQLSVDWLTFKLSICWTDTSSLCQPVNLSYQQYEVCTKQILSCWQYCLFLSRAQTCELQPPSEMKRK